MAQAAHLNLDSPRGRSGTKIAPLPDEETQLRETLRYCTPSTYEAARLFRTTARADYVAPILQGILLHYMEPDLRAQFRVSADTLRLQEDLGLDSLTMMEIVIRLEDVLQISIRDDELRQIRTVGEIRALIERTVAAASHPTQPPISNHS